MKINLVIKSTLALVLVAGISSSVAVAGAAQTKGATQLLWTPKPAVSTAPVQATDCPTGMACDKCKDVPTKAVVYQKGHVRTEIASTKHLCSNCATSSNTVGTGKAVRTVFEHTCADTKSAAASCCN